jgi:hypothetical protein
MKKTLLVLTLCAFFVFPMHAEAARKAKPAIPETRDEATSSAPVRTSAPSSLNGMESAQSGGEDWKGASDTAQVHLGALLGLGVIDSVDGFVLLGTASKKIIQHGFVPDINDSVSLETELGPLFTQGTTAFAYSLHLRWDFQKDPSWTIFAIGGLAGDTGASLGSRWVVLPRFGVGAFYKINELFMARFEVSHELIAAGLTFPFWF